MRCNVAICTAAWSVVLLALVPECFAMSNDEKRKMRGQVKEMFRHAYNSYMSFAYPADELMPLSCKGRVRGVDPSRGDVDDALGMFSLTLVDTLDTLAVLGEVSEFEKAVKLVIKDVHFDTDVVVSVFETNIRIVGGLLGGHVAADSLKKSGKGLSWYNGELLALAKKAGECLLPAFNTTTGIPYPKVNLKYGIHHPDSNTGTEVDTCTACAGTMIMEFGALSRLTGDPIFEEKAKKAMESLWKFRSRASDLVGTVINIHNGDWVRRDSGVGAGIDSYYEYCLKAYILLGDDTYLDRFNKHYKSIMQYINQGAMFLSVQMHQPERTSHAYMDALQAFWPGLQVLKGDLKKAIEMHHMLYEVAKKHTFLPEAFTTDFEVHWGEHPLRPELVESTYFLYEATLDPYYLEVGRNIVEKINEHARVPCGFAALKDVRTLSHEDRMDSFVLAETFKYLYLLFTDKSEWTLPMNDFILTTEAHLLPLSLSSVSPNGTAYEQIRYNLALSSENEYDFTCPNSVHPEGKVKYAEEVRRQMLLKTQGSCPKQAKGSFSFSSDKPPRLRAEQFVPGNSEHLSLLKSMGITVAQTKEGKIQLMHTASSAFSQQEAEEGIKFMQEMIELAKQRNDQGDIVHKPRVVQLMSPPYDGSITLNAGPAQFGLDLSKGDVGVGAEVVVADPIKGCVPLLNQEEAKHRIVILERGECMFIDKARNAQKAGALAVIIIDNNDGSSSDSQPIFAMAGDGTSNDVRIPAVLLFHQEGQILMRAITAVEDTSRTLSVRVAAKAIKAGEKPASQEKRSNEAEGKQPSAKAQVPEDKVKAPSGAQVGTEGKVQDPVTAQVEELKKRVEEEEALLQAEARVFNKEIQEKLKQTIGKDTERASLSGEDLLVSHKEIAADKIEERDLHTDQGTEPHGQFVSVHKEGVFCTSKGQARDMDTATSVENSQGFTQNAKPHMQSKEIHSRAEAKHASSPNVDSQRTHD
ncbi:ER degradation-enhancing alpha-mannosidase-like protein 3 [Nematostella vectensis]|uniref:ER degradation-enhancing alpha-mannosidase-like protein 3 n=1 Tax=Nematostella vectensis TaxID=45351 RepID=UPI002076E65E|nr:ER degradation-enhancing alpha-mannosidase-like protein 3 [Nematostella vectensis]